MLHLLVILVVVHGYLENLLVIITRFIDIFDSHEIILDSIYIFTLYF
jgi:hypothetical protein